MVLAFTSQTPNAMAGSSVIADISQIDWRLLWLPLGQPFAGARPKKKSCVPSFEHRAGLKAIRHRHPDTAGAVGDALDISEQACNRSSAPVLTPLSRFVARVKDAQNC